MKPAILVAVVMAIAATDALHGQTPVMPPVIRDGLEIYKVKGSAAAIARWMKDSPITDGSELGQVLPKIEGFYGRMVGYELLDVVRFGAYASRSYIVILFEKGPVYAWFDCYLPKDQWIVTSLLFNTKPDMILPAKMLSH